MRKFTIFRIGDETFGIEIDRVVEILRTQKSFTIPGLTAFLTGVTSVRGLVVPLIDLRRRFGMPPAGRKERIIIVRFGAEKVGFIVDEVLEILGLETAEIRTPPSVFKGFRTDYLTGIGKKGERIIILLNVDRILTSEEKIQLKESMQMLEEKGGGDRETAR